MYEEIFKFISDVVVFFGQCPYSFGFLFLLVTISLVLV